MASIIAKETGAPRELIPAGNHVARCVGMVQIGTVKEFVMGQEKEMHKIRITWELPYETKVFDKEKGEQPLVFSKEFTLSLSDRARLRALLESWRGKAFTAEELEGFDVTKVVGHSCMLNIIHEASKKDPTKHYEELASIATLAKGTVCPPQVNPSRVLSYDDFNWDYFNSLPDFIKDKMKTSVEFKAMTATTAGQAIPVVQAEEMPPPIDPSDLIDESSSDLPF